MSDGAGPFIVDAVEALRRFRQPALFEGTGVLTMPFFDGAALKDAHRVRRALAGGAIIAVPAGFNLTGLGVGEEDCGCGDLHCTWTDMGDRVERDCWVERPLGELLQAHVNLRTEWTRFQIQSDGLIPGLDHPKAA